MISVKLKTNQALLRVNKKDVIIFPTVLRITTHQMLPFNYYMLSKKLYKAESSKIKQRLDEAKEIELYIASDWHPARKKQIGLVVKEINELGKPPSKLLSVFSDLDRPHIELYSNYRNGYSFHGIIFYAEKDLFVNKNKNHTIHRGEYCIFNNTSQIEILYGHMDKMLEYLKQLNITGVHFKYPNYISNDSIHSLVDEINNGNDDSKKYLKSLLKLLDINIYPDSDNEINK